MATFRYKELFNSVASNPSVNKRINTIANSRFEAAKQTLLSEFDGDAITQEIKGGIDASNSSQTLVGAGNSGKGTPNLFSFIGFKKGSDPISPLRDVLENDLHLAKSNRGVVEGNKIKWRFSLRIPLEAIRAATVMPWESGNSWADSIEKGISGFSHYLAGVFSKSRSGGGIQAKNEVRAIATSTPRPYLTRLFKNFISSFRGR